MAIKKSELYSTLWASCDELRGGMDASQYKDYVLVMLFIKYISDKFAGVPYAPITVPEGASFKDMVALKGKPTIGDDINKKIIGKIAEANKLTGTIDVADFANPDKLGDGAEMVTRLTNLISIFENPALDFSKNRADGDDILGDAYEYLMQHFATESGKSKGQFYTPAEVSRIMSKVIGINNTNTNSETTVYDPTCGSGSLLLKVADEADKKVTIYGQEMDTATAGLARMNMILHNCPTAEIKHSNTLANPLFLNGTNNLKQFDFVVANPPFSTKAWSNGVDPVNDVYNRFQEFGAPPAKNGDYAFLLHIVRSLKSKGKGAIILPHGVLFRGNAEADIRKKLIRKGYIKGIIGLAPNLFYGTGIPACVIIIDKENAENRKAIFMIDAGKEFVKDGNKNRLREQDIHKIVDVFNKQLEIPKFSKIIKIEEIERNEYNLNIPRYIESQDSEDIQDIEAHLLGDIPNKDINDLEEYWKVYPSLKETIFSKSKRKNYSKIKIKQEDIKRTIFSHPEFLSFKNDIATIFNKWKLKSTKLLKGLEVGIKPKTIIHSISEDILKTFSDKDLIDKYDVYQHLMTYWSATMQDDVYLVSVDGWKADTYFITNAKGKLTAEWTCDLIPKQLVINRYFDKEQKAIEKLQTERESITQQIIDLEEEHSGEDGLLSEAKNDKDKITKITLQKRLKEIKADKETKDEQRIIEKYLKLIDDEVNANKKVKDALIELDKLMFVKYGELREGEIKTLVVDDKWMKVMADNIDMELERISQRLTLRVKDLADRYQIPISILNNEVKELENKVNKHLEEMEFIW